MLEWNAGKDTDLQSARRRVRLSGIHVRANVFGEDRPSPYRLPAVKEKHSARGRETPRADRPIGNMARDHNSGEQSEPHAARMGELLRGRRRQQGVSGARRLRGDAVAPVVALQAQSQATKGRELSTLACRTPPSSRTAARTRVPSHRPTARARACTAGPSRRPTPTVACWSCRQASFGSIHDSLPCVSGRHVPIIFSRGNGARHFEFVRRPPPRWPRRPAKPSL